MCQRFVLLSFLRFNKLPSGYLLHVKFPDNIFFSNQKAKRN